MICFSDICPEKIIVMEVIVFKLCVALAIVGMLVFIRVVANKSFRTTSISEEERNAA